MFSGEGYSVREDGRSQESLQQWVDQHTGVSMKVERSDKTVVWAEIAGDIDEEGRVPVNFAEEGSKMVSVEKLQQDQSLEITENIVVGDVRQMSPERKVQLVKRLQVRGPVKVHLEDGHVVWGLIEKTRPDRIDPEMVLVYVSVEGPGFKNPQQTELTHEEFSIEDFLTWQQAPGAPDELAFADEALVQELDRLAPDGVFSYTYGESRVAYEKIGRRLGPIVEVFHEYENNKTERRPGDALMRDSSLMDIRQVLERARTGVATPEASVG